MSEASARSTYIKWLFCIILSAIPLIFPVQGVYTQNVKWFLTITIFGFSLIALELVEEVVIGILIPSLYCLFQVAPVEQVMAPWLSTTMMMFFGAMFFAATLEQCGVLRRIALWVMCRSKGHYTIMLLFLMAAGMILNLLTAGRGYLVIGVLAFGICVSLNVMKTKVGAAVALAAMIGTCSSHAFLYTAGNWSVIKQMAAGYVTDSDINPLSMLIHNWPMFLVCALIVVIVAKWYKPTPEESERLKDLSYFEDELKKMGRMDRREKWNLFMMVLLLVYIFTVRWHGLDINYGFMIIPWILFLPFAHAADRSTLKKTNWSMGIFAAACMSVGTVASSLGLGVVFVNTFQTILNGNTNPIIILGLVFLLVFILNFLMTPVAIFSLITQPLLTLAVSLGFSAVPFAYAISSFSEAIIFPYEYVPYLIIYSFGMMKMKDFIALNALRSIVFIAGFLLILVPYWMLTGLL